LTQHVWPCTALHRASQIPIKAPAAVPGRDNTAARTGSSRTVEPAWHADGRYAVFVGGQVKPGGGCRLHGMSER
jgi:hypothetical protein